MVYHGTEKKGLPKTLQGQVVVYLIPVMLTDVYSYFDQILSLFQSLIKVGL